MFRSNKDFIKQLKKAFSEKDINFIKAHIADDIRWNIVGMPVIHGIEDFIRIMELIDIECFPGNSLRNIIAEEEFVVVESSWNIKTKTEKLVNPNLCEVYKVKNGKLKELTTYIVDTSVE